MSEIYTPKSWTYLKAYSWEAFKNDLIAGVTVGVVALPLAMAFAIASGVGPERGIYTAIIAGFFVSCLGGCRVQIGGPTGAFVVLLSSVIQRHGYEGLVMATLLASALLIGMGIFRLGFWIRFIPASLITGFTAAIALVIFTSQVKDFFGLQLGKMPTDFFQQWSVYFQALPKLHPASFCVSSGTLAAILLIRRYVPSLPWGIAAIFLSTLCVWGCGISVDTISSRFGQIPQVLPMPHLPLWKEIDLTALFPDALAIAFLAGIESLLSASIADRMIGGKHRPNCELIAQGIGNLGSILFGGIPATGAIARTATNIKSGAQTPVAGMIHSLTLLLILFAFAPLVGKIPLPALASVLMMVAWNMSELHHFQKYLREGGEDRIILLIAFFVTVTVDLLTAVGAGVAISCFFSLKKRFTSN